MRFIFFTLLSLILSNSALSSTDLRWESSIAGFKEYDNENTFPQNATLFVGSATINYWKTAKYFPDFKVINRGFGGSTINDLLRYYEDVIKKYNPAKIVLYTADNDCTSKREFGMIFSDYKNLLDKMRNDMPNVKIIVMSVKLCEGRRPYFEKIRQLNEKLREYINSDMGKNITYFDINEIICDAEGNVRKELFRKDMLHLNKKGYEILTKKTHELIK